MLTFIFLLEKLQFAAVYGWSSLAFIVTKFRRELYPFPTTSRVLSKTFIAVIFQIQQESLTFAYSIILEMLHHSGSPVLLHRQGKISFLMKMV